MPMSPGYIPFHPNPSKPKYKPPAGRGRCALPCVRAGERKFPYAPERKYTPCDAPKEKLFALRDFLGFDKNVIVQASCHSKDNRAMVDALDASNGRAKGVAFVGEEVTDDELKWMDKAGVRGVRFNFIKRLVDFTPRDVLQRIAARVHKLGWHIVIYFEMPDLPELEELLHRAAHHRRGRSHGHARREEGRRSSREPALPRADGQAQELLGEGDLPGAHDASPGRPTTTWCRSAARWSSAFPTASSGAPIGRIPT